MAIILDGKKLRDKILDDLKNKVAVLAGTPKLVVISVGDDAASKIYVNNKKKYAEKIGIAAEIVEYPQSVSKEVLLKEIVRLNNDPKVTAILVQLPLPEHIDKLEILTAITPSKDVDGFTPYNSGLLFSGAKPFAYPATPRGILRLLDEYNIEIEGQHVVIVGRSNIVGKPLAQMMLNRNATVTVCHSHTKNLADITKTADILVSAAGGKIIEDNMIKSNCVVVDVGIFRDEQGKLRGDVNFETVSKIASHITPVPGGVGPMTIASLMLNIVDLFENSGKS